MEKQYDFIAIGDTVTDAFIHLEDSSAHVDIDHGTRELCMRFGDKIPYDEVFVVAGVGNSANAAVSASRLGLKTAIVSNIGDDDNGREILKVFEKEKIGTEFVKINSGQKTNYHYVLWYGVERTILIKHERYDYKMPDIGSPRWVYLSSAGENSLPFHKALLEYLDTHKDIRLAFQPGTYQLKFGKEALYGIYRRSEILFCNKEEAQRILGSEETDIRKLLSAVHELGPKIVVITDGANGAYASDGRKAWSMPLYPDPKPPTQRTGAGDAFSSTFTVALAMGKDIETALKLAPINSMSVVQQIGARAGLLSLVELEAFLARAPADYFPRPF